MDQISGAHCIFWCFQHIPHKTVIRAMSATCSSFLAWYMASWVQHLPMIAKFLWLQQQRPMIPLQKMTDPTKITGFYASHFSSYWNMDPTIKHKRVLTVLEKLKTCIQNAIQLIFDCVPSLIILAFLSKTLYIQGLNFFQDRAFITTNCATIHLLDIPCIIFNDLKICQIPLSHTTSPFTCPVWQGA